MPLSSEKVENKPLNGSEIKDLIGHLIRKALDAEWAFSPGAAYPRIGFECTLKFHFLSPSMPKVTPIIRIEAPLEPAPLRDVPEGSDQGVLALKIEHMVENPNLERVHAGIPISVTTKTGTMPGQMFPKVEHHEVTYDPKDYPPVDEPKQADISAETAKEWGVKVAEVPDGAEISVQAEVIEAEPRAMGLRKKRTPKVAHIEAE